MYVPTFPPSDNDPSLLRQWITEELMKVSAEIAAVEGAIPVKFSPPDKPREGQIVLADGEKWNPGEGKGVYAFFGGAWHKL